VKTEIIGKSSSDIPPEMLEEMMKSIPFLEPKDIADAVIYLLGTPPHVQVCELLIRPMNEEF
jgi:NADP+-dependent farnesol dehydrogenase